MSSSSPGKPSSRPRISALRVGGGAERVVLPLVGGDGTLVGEHHVHPGAQRRRERVGRLVGRQVHQDGIAEGMTSHERHRFGGARPPPTRRLGERRTLGLRRPQDRKSTRLNSSHGYISYAV